MANIQLDMRRNETQTRQDLRSEGFEAAGQEDASITQWQLFDLIFDCDLCKGSSAVDKEKLSAQRPPEQYPAESRRCLSTGKQHGIDDGFRNLLPEKFAGIVIGSEVLPCVDAAQSRFFRRGGEGSEMTSYSRQ